MGGAVKVVVRLADGSIEADVRHTNPMPIWLGDHKMITDPEPHLREYLSMQSVWKTGDHTVAPVEYGIVVVDAIKKIIYTSNGYSNPWVIPTIALWRFARGNEETHKIYTRFLREGRLSLWNTVTGEKIEGFYAPDCDVSEESERAFRLEDSDRQNFFEVRIDFAPWEIIRFGQEPTDRSMLDRLIADGFPITDADKAGWDDYLAKQASL